MDPRQSLQSPDLADRTAAADALSMMGPDAANAAVELVIACGDDEAVRELAVAALEDLGPPPPSALEQLTTLVSSEEPLVAYWAITLLGRAGAAAKASEDQLAAALMRSSELSVRERAAWALGKIEATSTSACEALKHAATAAQPRLSRLATASLEQTQA